MAKRTAIAAFIAAKADLDAVLARLQAASDEHIGANPDEVNWGHVGSITEAVNMLEDAAQFLRV